MAADFLGGVLGDGGEAGVDVFHPAVAVDQQEGAGALFDGALEQVQGAGDAAPLVVHQDMGVLVGQLAGERHFVAAPLALTADVLQAEHPDHFAADADAGVEQRTDALWAQILAGQFAGARVLLRVVRVDGATAVERLEVVGEVVGVDVRWLFIGTAVAAIDDDGLQAVAGMQAPDAGARYRIGFAGGLGDQAGGFQQRIVRAVAVPRQAHDQVLLGARAHQMLQMLVLAALVQLQRLLQASVLFFEIEQAGFVGRRRFVLQQVAVQQLPAVALEGFAELLQTQAAIRAMQVVADPIAAVVQQLLLDLFVQAMPGLGFHQAGERGFDEVAELRRGHAEQALAAGIEEQHGPAVFVQPLETQHPESRGDG
ncbi:hypothetical protein D3C81_1008860 [compost metagenome]